MRPLDAATAGGVADRLRRAGVDGRIEGGWGVDALVGRATRCHGDLDLVIRTDCEAGMIASMQAAGWHEASDARPRGFVLADSSGRRVDVRMVNDPADGWVAGTIDGRPVTCLSVERQLAQHEGYEPGPQDVHDLALLHGLGGGTRSDAEVTFIQELTTALVGLPGVEAVTLGGSRAQRLHRADSDWDVAIYYRGRLDPADVVALGWPGQVFAPGDWGGGVMNGGAWVCVDGRPVDVHYRDLSAVERHVADAAEGGFTVERLPMYVAGIPTYVVAGELARAEVLAGELPRPVFTDALRGSASRFWHGSAELSIGYAASAFAARADAHGVAANLARAVVEESHARLAADGVWVLNEKRIVDLAGLTPAKAGFAALGATADGLAAVIRDTASLLEV